MKFDEHEHYERVRTEYGAIALQGELEGWRFEYIDAPHLVSRRAQELRGKLVCRAYWIPRNDGNLVVNVQQPAYMYRHSFKRLADVVPNSPVSGYALLFEDGTRDSLCYDTVCVALSAPDGI